MALAKTDHRLEEVKFIFDGVGNVIDVLLQGNYAIVNDAQLDFEGNPSVETRVRKVVSIWDVLTDTQKTQANTIGKRFNTLAAQL